MTPSKTTHSKQPIPNWYSAPKNAILPIPDKQMNKT